MSESSNKTNQNNNVINKRTDWDANFKALREFGEINGHCNVPLRHEHVIVNGCSVNLGSWLATQRRIRLNNKLRPERFALLQKLSDDGMFNWTPFNHLTQSEHTWPFMYECFKQYCSEQVRVNGNYPVKSVPEGLKWIHESGAEINLGRWMHTQNKQRRAQKLRPERMQLMQSLISNGLFQWPNLRRSQSSSSDATPLDAPIRKRSMQDMLDNASSDALNNIFESEFDVWGANLKQVQHSAEVRISDAELPLATMPFVRELAAKYFTTSLRHSPQVFDIIYPLPKFGLSPASANSNSFGFSEMVLYPSEPIPVVMHVNDVHIKSIAENIKAQVIAQVIAYLCLRMPPEYISNEFIRDISAGVVKLLFEQTE